MKKYNKKQVAKLIRKAIKESKEPYSYMDVHGTNKWIKKNVK